MDPFGEWFGEECVVAAGVVEVLGGVDEGSGAWRVSVGPFGPGVDGRDAVLGVEEPVVVAVEAAGELSVGGDVVLDSVRSSFRWSSIGCARRVISSSAMWAVVTSSVARSKLRR